MPEKTGENAYEVYFHHAALDGDQNFIISRIPRDENPLTILCPDNSHPMELAPGFKELWSLRWDAQLKRHMPHQLYVYTTRKCAFGPTSNVCVYRSTEKSRKRPRLGEAAPKRRTKRSVGKPDDHSGDNV